MSISTQDFETIIPAIKGIYSHLLFSNVPNDAPYKGVFTEKKIFGLDEIGYYDYYRQLLRGILAITEIGDKWSVAGLEDKIHELLLELANAKSKGEGDLDIVKLAHDWLNRIDIEFPMQECLIPVNGLRTKVPITIGTVTFHPLESKKQELEERTPSKFFEELSPYCDSLASSKFKAEPRRSTELLRNKTEEALNIFRYIGSLVRHREDPRHIYVAGQEKRRTSYSLVVHHDGMVEEIGNSEYSPVPYTIDEEYIQYANFYGFDFIQQIFRKETRTPIQQAFLTAIQWYGDAIQENNPLFAFSKFYTSIETVSKLEKESARNVLPRRLSVLIESWDRKDQRHLEDGIEKMIFDRNFVFHTGQPSQNTPEYLAWFSRIIAMQTMHHLRLLITSENIQTKEDFKKWAINQYDQYLRK
jgi:hypothetical protein